MKVVMKADDDIQLNDNGKSREKIIRFYIIPLNLALVIIGDFQKGH